MEKHATRPWNQKSELRSGANNTISSLHSSAAFDGLPEPFIAGLRTLFDVMDDQNTGFVRLSDIQKQWRDDGEDGVPKGVVDCLKKVTPGNGLLSFERFCAGLKICLLRNRAQQPKTATVPPVRPPSAPVLDLDRDEMPIEHSRSKKPGSKVINMATVRPNNVTTQEQQVLRSAVSMPHLNEEQNAENLSERPKQHAEPQVPKGSTAVPLGIVGPPKPPRVGSSDAKSSGKSEIRAALHCWHMGLLHSDSESVKSGSDFELSAIVESASRKEKAKENRLNANSQSLNNLSWEADVGGGGGGGTVVSYLQASLEVGNPLRRSSNRRREPRRHTLQSGIDYNMLKRLKQVEQEREMLLTGLKTLDKARDWYLGQVSIVEEKLRDVGRNGQLWEHNSEAYQERLNFQRARIGEVNQHLIALIESSEKGFPLHMNLALRLPTDTSGSSAALNSAHAQMQINNRSIFRLKDQNRQLTEEVGKKTERITALEREKAVLIRELFQARSKMRGSANYVYQMPPNRPQQPVISQSPTMIAPRSASVSSSPVKKSISSGLRRPVDESAFL
ncbi:unnamed protein product [Notodromas monacha]|uniref:Suppressor APC domain-containing protein n=1 Tax=Notodromas monacha TaxID=399045 RepID=A0A7R9GDQ2_9CRUS|nr:unnamed protein product [Notodromas monacha]CAG0917191.1 unnamed protein product [Notodromas monacha]